jgi:hypothetical protein
VHIVVELEGVLQGAYKKDPIATGTLMVGALSAYNQLTFISDMHKNDAERWINEHKIVDFDNLLGKEVALVGEDLKERQLTMARANGGVGLFITSNPALWAFAFDQGIPSVMFGVPSYLRPEFRPDAPKRMRSWDEIEEAVKRQNEAMTKDARIHRTETVRFE